MDRRQVAKLALMAAAALTPAAAAASTDSGEKKKKTGGLSYIPLDSVSATIVRRDGRRGVLSVETGLDVPSPALHDYALQVVPRLKAAFVQAVQIYGAGMSPGLPPNVDFLSRELQRQTDLTLGKPGARLLLGSVLIT
jgi:hypothetical protein